MMEGIQRCVKSWDLCHDPQHRGRTIHFLYSLHIEKPTFLKENAEENLKITPYFRQTWQNYMKLQRSFSFLGAKIWHCLPTQAKQASSLSCFESIHFHLLLLDHPNLSNAFQFKFLPNYFKCIFHIEISTLICLNFVYLLFHMCMCKWEVPWKAV